MRAIITGPEGTPYTGGVYEFDVYFPSGYPGVAPQVHFRTTGGGTVRFNPNLYKDGKVCLSLLGTWQGSAGEHWDQNTSTILQVNLGFLIIQIQRRNLLRLPVITEITSLI